MSCPKKDDLNDTPTVRPDLSTGIRPVHAIEMKIERISLLDTYTRIVESRSLSSVARELGISQSTVSRRLGELESGLGVRLLNRNTRGMVPTRDGQVFYEYAREIVTIADKAAQEISGDETGCGGLVRVGTSASFGQAFLAPVVREILDRWPLISIDFRYLDGVPDIYRHGLDIAIWTGPVADQSLIKKKIGVTDWLLVASSEYLDRAGRPTDPEQLGIHECIRNTESPYSDEWRFRYPGELSARTFKVGGKIAVNTVEASLTAVKAGLGIAPIPSWKFGSNSLPEGIEKVMERYSMPQTDIQLLFASRELPARIRAVLDYLAERLQGLNDASPLPQLAHLAPNQSGRSFGLQDVA